MQRLILFFVFYPFLLNAQAKFDDTWLFGGNGGDSIAGFGGTVLRFNTDPPSNTYAHLPFIIHASSAISDSLGKLLFYCNGCEIANDQHKIIKNSEGINLGGASYQQSCQAGHGYDTHQGILTLPYPGHPERYILLHLHRPGEYKLIEELLYTEVDMSQDAGLGAVTAKNQLAYQDTMVDMLTAVRHANGRDWWIVLPKFNAPTYYVFLLSPNGISAPLIQHGLGEPIIVGSWGIQATFSPNGKKYANLSWKAGLQVFDFDRCTGRLTKPLRVPIPSEVAFAAGIAFSPSSRYLYASADDLYQFDLTASPLADSRTTVGVFDGFVEVGVPVNFYQLMLAPDHKIYMSTGNGSRYLHVIRQPDKKGTDSEFVQRDVHLWGYHAFSVPNFPHFRLFDVPGSPCDTLGINGLQPPEDTLVPPDPPLPCTGDIRLHPNPATTMTLLELPRCQGGLLTVFDVAGRKVLEMPLAAEVVSVPLDVSNYVSGVYLLRIRTADGEVVTRSLAVVR